MLGLRRPTGGQARLFGLDPAALRLSFQSFEVRSLDDFESAFDAMVKARVEQRCV